MYLVGVRVLSQQEICISHLGFARRALHVRNRLEHLNLMLLGKKIPGKTFRLGNKSVTKVFGLKSNRVKGQIWKKLFKGSEGTACQLSQSFQSKHRKSLWLPWWRTQCQTSSLDQKQLREVNTNSWHKPQFTDGKIETLVQVSCKKWSLLIRSTDDLR